MGLLNLLENLTSDERLERVVHFLAKQAVSDWETMRQGRAVAGSENHALDVYVPPHISIRVKSGEISDTEERDRLKQEEQEKVPSTTPPGFKRLAQGIDELIAQYILGDGGRVVLYEDAGAGKTVFTWKLREALSRLELPCLALRFERQWETNIEAYVQDAVKDACGVEKCHPRDIARKLLEERRVVLIFDAADQQANEFLKKQFHASISHETNPRLAGQLRIVVTSRAFRVREQDQHLFQAAHWQHACIELFDEKQQEAFKKQLAAKAKARWALLVPNERQFADQLRFPEVLKMIREIAEDPESKNREPFHHRADLYVAVADRRLDRAFKNPNVEASRDLIPTLKKVLACLAFEMMLKTREQFGYAAPGDLAKSVRDSAMERFHATDSRKRTPQEAIQKEWDACAAILENTELTDRSILESNGKRHLSFRSLKMLEFFAGWYLSNVTSEDDLTVVQRQVGKETWYWPWRFALQLADSSEIAKPYSVKPILRGLGPLFSQPIGNCLRPTELMYRSWALFQETKDDELKTESTKIIESFQRQFLSILRGDDLQKARVAAQLVPEFVLRGEVEDEKRLVELLPADEEPAFVLCPPRGWRHPYEPDRDPCVFWMGTDPRVNRAAGWSMEWPRHPVRVAPFWMQTTSVTKEQYRIFDPSLELSGAFAKDINDYARENDCPMICTSWFDATIFALWTGNRLPTETLREYATRAGRDNPVENYGIPLNGQFRQLTSQIANFDGQFPYPDVEDDLDVEGLENNFPRASFGSTLPVRWTKERRSTLKMHESRKPPAFVPNAWKLWQMHGNILEWCSSVYDEGFYRRRALEMTRLSSSVPPTPSANASRHTNRSDFSLPSDVTVEVLEAALQRIDLQNLESQQEKDEFDSERPRALRGGAWLDRGGDCRSAKRAGSEPKVRYRTMGFRLYR